MALRESEEAKLTTDFRPASEAFRVHFNDLMVAIQDPEILACALYSVDIISSGIMNEVGMIALSPVQKNMKLLGAVGDKLKAVPEKFKELLIVLKNNDPSLRDVAQKLEETYAKFISQPISAQVPQKTNSGNASSMFEVSVTRLAMSMISLCALYFHLGR